MTARSASGWLRTACVHVEAGGAVGELRQRGFGTSALRGLLALPSLVRRVARRAACADVVYANTQRAMAVCVLGKWLHRRPVVWHLRDIVDDSFFGRTQRTAIRLLSRGLTRVIANSQASADAFRALAGNGVPIEVVHNGIDPAPFDAARCCATAWRCAWPTACRPAGCWSACSAA